MADWETQLWTRVSAGEPVSVSFRLQRSAEGPRLDAVVAGDSVQVPVDAALISRLDAVQPELEERLAGDPKELGTWRGYAARLRRSLGKTETLNTAQSAVLVPEVRRKRRTVSNSAITHLFLDAQALAQKVGPDTALLLRASRKRFVNIEELAKLLGVEVPARTKERVSDGSVAEPAKGPEVAGHWLVFSPKRPEHGFTEERWDALAREVSKRSAFEEWGFGSQIGKSKLGAAGRPVLFWRAGSDAGVVACGQIRSGPSLDGDGAPKVDVELAWAVQTPPPDLTKGALTQEFPEARWPQGNGERVPGELLQVIWGRTTAPQPLPASDATRAGDAALVYLTAVPAPQTPPSIVLSLASVGGRADDPQRLATRRERLASVLTRAFALGPGVGVRERMPGHAKFDAELTGLADRSPIIGDALQAEKWANGLGGGAVYVRLCFNNLAQRTAFLHATGADVIQDASGHGPQNIVAFLAALVRPGEARRWRTRSVFGLAGAAQPRTLILEGVPGTGKTWAIKQLLQDDDQATGSFRGRGDGRFAITLHPATSYEDFVEGLRPGPYRPAPADRWAGSERGFEPVHIVRSGEQDAVEVSIGRSVPEGSERWFVQAPAADTSEGGGQGTHFAVHDGFFLRACAEALCFPTRDFLVLLDEINRCNVPKVLGDLLTTLEFSKRATWDPTRRAWDLSSAQVVSLPYSKRLFFVPDNVFVVATMNTTDRSVAPLDSALRRRFAFQRLWPLGFEDGSTLRAGPGRVEDGDLWDEAARVTRAAFGQNEGEARPTLLASVRAWLLINRALFQELGPDGMLGHSYLFDLAADLRSAANSLSAAGSVADQDRWRCQSPVQDDVVQHHWNQHILAQLVDVLESNNRLELLGDGESALHRVLHDLVGIEWQLAGSGLLRRADIRLRRGFAERPTTVVPDATDEAIAAAPGSEGLS